MMGDPLVNLTFRICSSASQPAAVMAGVAALRELALPLFPRCRAHAIAGASRSGTSSSSISWGGAGDALEIAIDAGGRLDDAAAGWLWKRHRCLLWATPVSTFFGTLADTYEPRPALLPGGLVRDQAASASAAWLM
jgi:hypothetical protein